MKKICKIFGIPLLSLLFIVNCNDKCGFMRSCTDKREISEYERYFPLEVDNKWVYSYNGKPDYYMKVVGKKEINDNEYFKVLHSSVDNKYRTTVYYRWEDSKLFELNEDDNFESLLADFSLKEGEEFQKKIPGYGTDGYDVTVLSDDPNEFTFYYDSPELADEEHTIIFRINIGKFKERGEMLGKWATLTSYDLHCNQ